MSYLERQSVIANFYAADDTIYDFVLRKGPNPQEIPDVVLENVIADSIGHEH